jgi:hypothetical protein
VLLGVVAAVALWAAFPLVEAGAWAGLGILAAATLGIFYVYLSRRHIPAKYLVTGTLFLLVFLLLPVLYTATSVAFSNFGDGHRGNKEQAITAIETASVTQVPGSAEYALSVATTGEAATGELVFLLSDPATGQVFAGDPDGLTPLPPGSYTVDAGGRVTGASGYTILNAGQASAAARRSPGSRYRPTAARSSPSGCRGPTRAGRCGPTTRRATASWTPAPEGGGAPTTRRGRSSPRTATGWRRAGGSTWGSTT